MKNRIWGAISALFGLAAAVPGVMSAMNSIQGMPTPAPDRIGGTGIAALVRYYDLRWEILLVALGVVLLLTAAALFLSPVRRRVAITADDAAVDHGAPPAEVGYLPFEAGAAAEPSAGPAPVPVVECYLTTRLVGATFANPDGASRQSVLAAASVGDVVVCRTVTHRYSPDTIGVYTVSGKQLGCLDAAFVRAIRDRYPDRRIGVYVDRIGGGGGLPYTCDLRVAVYRG